MTFDHQMKLFQGQNQQDFGRRLDVVGDLKRELRRELSRSRYGRDEISLEFPWACQKVGNITC